MKRFVSPSTVIATVAVVLGLTGGAIATVAQPTLTTTTLTPIHGWTTAGFGNAGPSAGVINGVVFLHGAISNPNTTSPNNEAFVLPIAYRPTHTVWLTADMCNAAPGRIQINTDGSTFVEFLSPTTQSEASCFTSLDGIQYIK
jgi:hypothetical protein